MGDTPVTCRNRPRSLHMPPTVTEGSLPSRNTGQIQIPDETVLAKLVLHERDDLLRAARADWAADTGLREDYMTRRPNVERAVAQVATFRGRRVKLRYREVARNHAWLKRRTAAVNLRNLLGKGLTRRDGAWVLAT